MFLLVPPRFVNKIRNAIFVAGEDAQFTCVIQSAPKPKVRYGYLPYVFFFPSFWFSFANFFWTSTPSSNPVSRLHVSLFKVVQGWQAADWPAEISDLQWAPEWRSGSGNQKPDGERPWTLWVRGWSRLIHFHLTVLVLCHFRVYIISGQSLSKVKTIQHYIERSNNLKALLQVTVK